MVRPAYEYEKELLKKVQPAMRYGGEDYDQWKPAARKKLAELLGMDRYQKCDPAFQMEIKTEKEGYTDIGNSARVWTCEVLWLCKQI